MKVLLKEYGDYNNLPLSIEDKILEIEEFNMSEMLRKKNRILSHLAIATEFKFIEIDMSNLVSYESFEYYEKQIRSRENLRNKRRAQEERYNDKAQKIEEK